MELKKTIVSRNYLGDLIVIFSGNHLDDLIDLIKP